MGHLVKGGNSYKIRPISVRFRYIFAAATIFGGCFLIITLNNRPQVLFLKNEALSYSESWHVKNILLPSDSFTIKTEGCTIPNLKAFDESIKKFVTPPKTPNLCPKSNASLLNYNDTHIWIVFDNLQFYDVPEDVNITCCHKSFYRPSSIPDVSASDIDDRVTYETCIFFSNYIEVVNEFIKVSCGYDDTVIYEQFFAFTPKKPFVSRKEDLSDISQNHSAYNVIIMGIDAVSRLNFHRTMPKTLAYLRKKGAIELLGYNKVGDNTFPNLIPMLLGIKETDLKTTCWPNIKTTFDNCPFIWEWFKDAGYYTALGEDSASLGTFNFGKIGFSGTPTDYYLHTFIHEAEHHVGNNRDYNSFICMGNKYFFNALLDYILKLTETLKSSKLFGFFWEVTMSHDFLNYPVAMDANYENFLRTLDNSKYLQNTILILLSDHGIRWGDIRFTKQGRLEERLPLVQILLPPSFRENYSLAYNNLKLNSKRLTTPFDIHAMLSDLVNTEVIKDSNIKTRIERDYSKDRGISLFLPIPKNRSCELANIDDHWCTCHEGHKISSQSKTALEAAESLMLHLNDFIFLHTSRCAWLSVAEVIEATELVVGTPRKHEVGWREFMVMVRATPGGGVFEGTLRREKHKWTVAGTVSRLNLYGNQSHCVQHYQLKLYCYCR